MLHAIPAARRTAPVGRPLHRAIRAAGGDEFERRSDVERRHDREDRRVARLFLSSAGKKVLSAIDVLLLEIHRSQFGRLKPKELQSLKELLKRIV